MVEKITKYLSKKERDYDEGLILLSKTSRNRILIQLLGRKELKDKLEYELQKVIDRDVLLKVVKTQKVKTPKVKTPKDDVPVIEKPGKLRVIRGDNKINYDDLPDALQTRWDENTDAYKGSRSLHEKLKLMENAKAEDRKPLIGQIISLHNIIRANWEIIDAYDPTKKVESKEDKKINHKRIQANRKYISVNFKKLKEKPDNKELKKRIQDRITELVKAGETFKDANKFTELGFEL